MATREFESGYVNTLAECALVGLRNHIENEWVRKSRTRYELNRKVTRCQRFVTWCVLDGPAEPKFKGTFEEFVEESRGWMYSNYSDTYTWWKDHIEGYIKTELFLERLRRISEENIHASEMTRLDDSEYSKLRHYAKIERT